MSQLLQVVGALLLLCGFVAAQRGVITDASKLYLTVNAAGGALLAVLAFLQQDWGFLLLEGTWALVSAISLIEASRSVPAGPTPTLPAARAPRLRGTELADPQQLIRLFRATYGAAQGRQWLQAHIFWWSLTFLRDNGISLDLETLSDPVLGQKVVAMALPRGHAGVEPKGQAEMNFGLWWAIFIDVAQTVFRQRRRMLPDPGPALPDATSLRLRATNLGLHQWMSSATFEELAGITAALEMIGDRERRGRPTADEIMTEVLLPELLLTEMHWLHAPNGRTNSPGNPRADIVFLRRYARARARWADERQLNPVDQMYLRAGDILDHFDQLDQNERRALNLDSMLSMYDDIRHADLAVPR